MFPLCASLFRVCLVAIVSSALAFVAAFPFISFSIKWNIGRFSSHVILFKMKFEKIFYFFFHRRWIGIVSYYVRLILLRSSHWNIGNGKNSQTPMWMANGRHVHAWYSPMMTTSTTAETRAAILIFPHRGKFTFHMIDFAMAWSGEKKRMQTTIFDAYNIKLENECE